MDIDYKMLSLLLLMFCVQYSWNSTAGVLVNAFVVPTSTTTTVVPNKVNKDHQSATSKPTVNRFRPVSSLLSKSTNTQLYMGSNLVDRFTRVVKSNLNKFVSNIEDPEKVINQSVIDMQNDLVKVRQSYAEAVASQRRIQRQLDEINQNADEWYYRAQLALKKQKTTTSPNHITTTNDLERLAREALVRRETILERKILVEKQLVTQTTVTEQLYNSIQSLEEKIREIMYKQQQLVARARTVEATKQIQSMISNVGDLNTATAVSNSINAFTRMEQKVEAMEAAVEVSMELNQMLPSFSSSSWSLSSNENVKSSKRSIEDDFRYLEQSSKIDEEMEMLKEQLLLTSNSKMNNQIRDLPPASSTITATNTDARVTSIPIQQPQQSRQDMVTIS